MLYSCIAAEHGYKIMSDIYRDELRHMFRLYIDESTGAIELKEALESTSADTKYSLIKEVRGEKFKDRSMLHASALRNNVEMMKCLLHGLNPNQRWQVLETRTSVNSTALLLAGHNGCIPAAKYLLESTPVRFRFEYLKMKSNMGNTVLHVVAREKRPQTAQVLLLFLSPPQQIELLKIPNNDNQSAVDIFSAKYRQGLPNETRGTILAALVDTALKSATVRERPEHGRELADAIKAIDGLTKELETEKQKRVEMGRKIARQSAELHQLKVMQEEMLARFETFLKQPICTSHVEDQEIPDVD